MVSLAILIEEAGFVNALSGTAPTTIGNAVY